MPVRCRIRSGLLTEIELMQRRHDADVDHGRGTAVARVCNLGHELGTLEPGKVADVLVVNGDPLQDIRALIQVRLVIHNGIVIRK
jgi:cytosine/adenosine deaminase-related metal-dependent hydrolase